MPLISTSPPPSTAPSPTSSPPFPSGRRAGGARRNPPTGAEGFVEKKAPRKGREGRTKEPDGASAAPIPSRPSRVLCVLRVKALSFFGIRPKKITAAIVPARSQPFEIHTLDPAAPQPDEVRVRIVASGMCHTDLHARDGYFPNLPYPVVCGHEGAGIVEEVGSAVPDLAPGDPVVISFPWCGECEPCLADRISYCTNARGLKSSGRRADGSTPMSRDGQPVYSCFFQQSSFATFALAPAKDVVKLRRDAPIEMLGPRGCGLQTRPPPGL